MVQAWGNLLMLRQVPLSRQLEAPLKLFGFEIFDLLIIFLNLSILNLIFSHTSFKYPVVWGSTLVLALVLYFSKKNKPPNYLLHKIEHLRKPSTFSAGVPDFNYTPYIKEIETQDEEE